jgi:hypothetical protein
MFVYILLRKDQKVAQICRAGIRELGRRPFSGFDPMLRRQPTPEFDRNERGIPPGNLWLPGTAPEPSLLLGVRCAGTANILAHPQRSLPPSAVSPDGRGDSRRASEACRFSLPRAACGVPHAPSCPAEHSPHRGSRLVAGPHIPARLSQSSTGGSARYGAHMRRPSPCSWLPYPPCRIGPVHRRVKGMERKTGHEARYFTRNLIVRPHARSAASLL